MQRWSATGAKNPNEPIIEPVGKTFDTDASAICTSLCSFEEPVLWRSKDTYLASYLNFKKTYLVNVVQRTNNVQSKFCSWLSV